MEDEEAARLCRDDLKKYCPFVRERFEALPAPERKLFCYVFLSCHEIEEECLHDYLRAIGAEKDV